MSSHAKPFGKIHDLGKILEQAILVNAAFEKIADAANTLTPCSVAYRYPDEQGILEPSREEFDEALQHASAIYGFVLNVFPADARP